MELKPTPPLTEPTRHPRYPCHHFYNCAGGRIKANGTATAEASLCREGSEGPLCSICAAGYYMSDYFGCQLCKVGNAWLAPLLLMIVLVIVAAVLSRKPCQEAAMRFYAAHEEQLNEYAQRATIMFVTMQILIIMNATHTAVGGKEVPTPYLDFLGWMNFMTLDFFDFPPA